MMCLALVPAVASAWESPQQAVDAFVAWELGGGRLQTDIEGMDRHVHAEPDYEGVGADTVLVSDTHHLGKLRCKGTRCQVSVAYHLPARSDDNDLPIGNGHRARTQRVTYTVLAMEGDWRIDSRTLTDWPIVSPQTLATHMAGDSEDEDGVAP